MFRILIPFLFFLSGIAVYGQDGIIPIEDAVLKGKTSLAPEKLLQPGWIPSGNLIYHSGKSDGKEFIFLKKPDGSLTNKISLEEISSGLEKPLDKIPQINWISDSTFVFQSGIQICLYSQKEKHSVILYSLKENQANPDLSPSGNYTAFTLENNLYISGKNIQLTLSEETNKDIISGQAVHRNEFGIVKGTFWSPDEKKLAFYRLDQSMVSPYPLVDIHYRPARLDQIRYPMAGMTSHKVKLGVFDIQNKKTIFLKTRDDDHYLTNITWSPDAEYIYIAELNRDQNHLQLNKYRASNGDYVETMLEERSEKYVEPEHGPVFLNDKSGRFIWFSNKDGYTQLYLHDAQGKLIRKLTNAKNSVTEFSGFGPDYKSFYFVSADNNGLERQLYVSDMLGKARRLTKEAGVHSVLLNKQGTLFLDQFSSLQTPRITRIGNVDGNLINNLLISENPLKNYKIGETRLLSLKSNGGSVLNARMILPPAFDSTKKYPVFYYVYGGPHVQLVLNSWLGNSDLFLQHMAQRGYIVFTLDNRGSGNRGMDFEQATFRELGSREIEDQLTGIRYLQKLAYVDTSKMGIQGWSFGGFMTISLMTRQPGIFKAAVAGGPVIDWSYYEVMYTERYMDTPQDNPEGYKNSSLLNYYKNLKGRLMLIHGSSDDVVLWQHSLMFIQKCVEAGIPVDYFVYPGHKHNVLGPDRVHLLKKIEDYMDTYVKGN